MGRPSRSYRGSTANRRNPCRSDANRSWRYPDIAKIDWHPNDKDYVYLRWIHDNYDLVDPFGTFNSSALPNTPTLRNRPGYGPQASYSHTFSANFINEVK